MLGMTVSTLVALLLLLAWPMEAAALDTISYGRSTERILIVLFGGMSLYLGYRLFFRATEAQGDLEAKGGDKLYLRMRNVAPGVFFALFGGVVLVVSLVYQVEISDDDRKARFLAPVFENGEGAELDKRIAALSALLTFYRDRADQALEGAERTALQQASVIIESLLGDLIDARMGEGSYNLYERVSAKRTSGDPSAIAALEEGERERFLAIDKLLSYGALWEKRGE